MSPLTKSAVRQRTVGDVDRKIGRPGRKGKDANDVFERR